MPDLDPTELAIVRVILLQVEQTSGIEQRKNKGDKL
jgi:hypothetical protein